MGLYLGNIDILGDISKTIEETLKVTDISSVTYVDNNITEMIYVTNNKVTYEYSNDNLTSEKIYDTDGTTLLLTITYTYDGNNNLTTTIRS
jgi:hypothetical protein